MDDIKHSHPNIKHANFKPYARHTIIWLIIILTRASFHHELADLLWMMLPLLDFALAAFGLYIVGYSIYALILFKTYFKSTILTAIAGGTIVLTLLTSFNFYIGTHVRLWRYQSTYQAIINAPDPTSLAKQQNITYESSEDHQDHFFMWFGMLDNVGGILYDTDGNIANTLKNKNTRQLVFGNTLAYVKHLRGNWYFIATT